MVMTATAMSVGIMAFVALFAFARGFFGATVMNVTTTASSMIVVVMFMLAPVVMSAVASLLSGRAPAVFMLVDVCFCKPQGFFCNDLTGFTTGQRNVRFCHDRGLFHFSPDVVPMILLNGDAQLLVHEVETGLLDFRQTPHRLFNFRSAVGAIQTIDLPCSSHMWLLLKRVEHFNI